jgi:hypothetical protein
MLRLVLESHCNGSVKRSRLALLAGRVRGNCAKYCTVQLSKILDGYVVPRKVLLQSSQRARRGAVLWQCWAWVLLVGVCFGIPETFCIRSKWQCWAWVLLVGVFFPRFRFKPHRGKLPFQTEPFQALQRERHSSSMPTMKRQGPFSAIVERFGAIFARQCALHDKNAEQIPSLPCLPGR